MNQCEYVSIRRAYNLIRQQADAADRIAFPELAVLCRLYKSSCPLSTASIAAYQHALRPTMTHRTRHLVSLGLVDSCRSESDKRYVNCSITDSGKLYVERICEDIRAILRQGSVLSRTTVQRIIQYIDAMGAIQCGSSDLIILQINSMNGAVCTVGKLAEDLGFLQPTTSMAISKLVRTGMVVHFVDQLRHASTLRLTEEGESVAIMLEQEIDELVVRRV